MVRLVFFLVTPYVLLFPLVFLDAFLFMKANVMYPIDTLWHKTIFPMAVTLPNSLGWALTLVVLVAIVFTLFDWKRNPVLWLWCATIWLGFLVVGRHAIPGPTLVLLCPFVLWAAQRLVLLKERFGRPKPVFYLAIGGLFIATFMPSLAVVEMRRTKPIQDESSEWIIANIPSDKVIGIPRSIYWW